MPWVLVDIAVPLLAVFLLVVAMIRLWKALKRLFRTMGESGERVGPASDALAAAQAGGARAGAYPEGTPSEERE